MADILNRLLLETKDFDAKLSNSKKGVNDYQGGITNMAKTAGVGIGKLAGALGLAMGAGEAFNRTLNSSQTLGDMTARNMAALKTSVDEFFYSLGSGEFFSFLNGLSDIINKAKEAHGAMDQLGNTTISHDFFSAENEGKIAKAQYTAKNKFAPITDRTKAFEDWRTTLDVQSEINRTLQSALVEAITTSIEAEIGTSKMDVTMDDVRMTLKIDVTNPQKRDELKSAYSAEYEEYKKGVSWIESKRKTSVSQAPARSFEINQRYDKEIEELTQKHRDAIVVNAMLNKYEDEELTNIASMSIKYQKLDTSLASISREYNETAMEFNNANKAVKGFVAVASVEGHKVYSGQTLTGSGGSPKPTPPPDGSIAAINEELAAKNKELINATTMQARVAVQTTINELEAKKINLQIATDKGIFAAEHGENKFNVSNVRKDFSQYTDIDKQISVKRKELISTTTEEARSAVQSTIDELEAKKVKLKVSLEKEVSNSTVDKQSQKNLSEYIDIDNKIAEQRTLLISTTTEEARSAVQSTIDELEARKIELSANIDIKSNMSSEIAGVLNNGSKDKDGKQITKGSNAFDLENVKKIKSPVSPKDVKLLEDYQANLYGISDFMGSMAGVMGESASSWLNWGASVLQSIAQAIPAIRALIPALAAKTAGEAASSAAQIPFVGWLAAGGAALSIISLFASLPKFANGGIIEGGSTFGDMNLARVNAGEMILNGMQQGNLFRLLNSGSSSSANNDSSVENIHFSAEYKLRGADIYTSLTNYIKKTGKKL